MNHTSLVERLFGEEVIVAKILASNPFQLNYRWELGRRHFIELTGPSLYVRARTDAIRDLDINKIRGTLIEEANSLASHLKIRHPELRPMTFSLYYLRGEKDGKYLGNVRTR